MEFKVCDALCGAGKTVSCINMMNRNTDTKYIFITPYLDEVDRIKRDCASRDFESPERSYPRNKSEDIQRLIREGKNIASTHSLFSNFTDETKELSVAFKLKVADILCDAQSSSPLGENICHNQRCVSRYFLIYESAFRQKRNKSKL